MTTAHQIDMREVRYVCGAAIVDYAAIIGMGGDEWSETFGRLGRLIDAAAATDWLASPDYNPPTQHMVDGLNTSPDQHLAFDRNPRRLADNMRRAARERIRRALEVLAPRGGSRRTGLRLRSGVVTHAEE